MNCAISVLSVLIGQLIGLPIGMLLFNRFSKYGSGKWEL